MIRRLSCGELPDTTSARSARPLARRLAAFALVGVSALTLSACQLTSPLQTMTTYEAAEGTNTQLGDLALDNLLVVGDAKGSPGNIVGMATNSSDSPIQLSVSASPNGQGGRPQTVVVPAQGTMQLTEPQGRTTTVPQLPDAPGAMMNLYVGTGSGQTSILVPIVPATQYYATLAPKSSGSPTQNPSSSAGGTGAPSAGTGTESPAQGGSPTQGGGQPQSTQAPTGTPSPMSTSG